MHKRTSYPLRQQQQHMSKTISSGQAPEAYTSSCATATTTATTAMMMTNVDDKASGASARHFHIVLRNGNDSNYGNDDEDMNVDEQAVYIVPNIDATINYQRQHRHVNSYFLNRRRQLSRRGRSHAQRHVRRAIVRMRTSYSVKRRRTTFNWPRQT